MRVKIVACVLFSLFVVKFTYGQGSLSELFNDVKRGQDYVQASTLIGQRFDSVGVDYAGLQQPASLVVSGIPVGATIEKAFLWWDHYGIDTSAIATLTNPSGISQTYSGSLIASDTNFCWGPQNVFRTDVTDHIEGNGSYAISDLVTSYQAKDTLEDTDGVTLLVIYSEVSSSNYGHLTIYDGFVKAEGDTLKVIVPVTSQIELSYGKAFMLATDMEYYYDAKISMNEGNYYLPGKDFWDFEQTGTTYSINQSEAVFALKPDIDCAHILAVGTLVNLPIDSIPAGINKHSELEGIKIYPNPANGEFTVNTPGHNYGDIVVYDVTGREVKRMKIVGQHNRVSLSNQSEGVYIVKVGGLVKKLILETD